MVYFNHPFTTTPFLSNLKLTQYFFLLILVFSFPINSIGQCNCDSQNVMDFDGIDDQIYLWNYSSPLDFTIAVWFKSPITPILGTEDRIFSFSNTNSLQVGLDNGGMLEGRLWAFDSSTGLNNSWGVNLHDNKWHHLAVTKDGTQRSIYLDGKLIHSWFGAANTIYGDGGGYFRLGSWPGPLKEKALFYGQLDNFNIYNIALNEPQLNQLMLCELEDFNLHLEVKWTFELGTPNGDNTMNLQVSDESGNMRDGDLTHFGLIGPHSNYVSINYDALVCEIKPNIIGPEKLNFYSSDDCGVYNEPQYSLPESTSDGDLNTGISFCNLNNQHPSCVLPASYIYNLNKAFDIDAFWLESKVGNQIDYGISQFNVEFYDELNGQGNIVYTYVGQGIATDAWQSFLLPEKAFAVQSFKFIALEHLQLDQFECSEFDEVGLTGRVSIQYIPTLSQWGITILVLSMVIVGFVTTNKLYFYQSTKSI